MASVRALICRILKVARLTETEVMTRNISKSTPVAESQDSCISPPISVFYLVDGDYSLPVLTRNFLIGARTCDLNSTEIFVKAAVTN